MVSNIFDTSTLPVLEQVVNFSQARHGVLAGNIANLDTPGYKTRDLSPQMFQESLKDAIQESRRPPSPGGGTAAEGGVSASSHNVFAHVQDSFKSIVRHDEVDVSLEHQIAEINKNQAQHNLAINLMSAQFRMLKAAISERQV